MNIQAPVSSLMATDLLTVGPKDKIQAVKDIFDNHKIHHIPVVDEESEAVLGILSKKDYLHFMRQIDPESREAYINELRLKNYKVEEIMSTELTTLTPQDSLRDALEILTKNEFHALPIIDNGKIAGILTTHDLLSELLRVSTTKAQ